MQISTQFSLLYRLFSSLVMISEFSMTLLENVILKIFSSVVEQHRTRGVVYMVMSLLCIDPGFGKMVNFGGILLIIGGIAYNVMTRIHE